MDMTIDAGGVKVKTTTEQLQRAAESSHAVRFAKDQLKAFVERIEKLEEEKKAIADDIRDVYAEAKANGFDVRPT